MMNIRRDHSTNAIINTDKTAYENYMIAKKNSLSNIELTKKINSLESELSDIKNLISKLIDK